MTPLPQSARTVLDVASWRRRVHRLSAVVAAAPSPVDDHAGSLEDRATIEEMVTTFFAAFATGPDLDARLEALRALFIPEAVIVRTCGLDPAAYSVDAFIEPRRLLLAGGSLVDFREWAESGQIEVFGDIAHWFGSYAKSWTQDGKRHEGRGMKSIQLVRLPAGWRISAAAWDDERLE